MNGQNNWGAQPPVPGQPMQQAPMQQVPMQQVPMQQVPMQQAPIAPAPVQQPMQQPIAPAPMQQQQPVQTSNFDPFAGFDEAKPSGQYNQLSQYPGTHARARCLNFNYEIKQVSGLPTFSAQFEIEQSETLGKGVIVDWAVFCGAGLRTPDMVATYFHGPVKALIASLLAKPIDQVNRPELDAALKGSLVGCVVGFRVVPSFNKKTGQPNVNKKTGQQYNDVLPFPALQQTPETQAPQGFAPLTQEIPFD